MQSAEAIIHFELKYCERCGGLWLRRCQAAAVYCSQCARQMADISRRRPRRQPSCPNLALAAITACLLIGLQPRLDMVMGWLA